GRLERRGRLLDGPGLRQLEAHDRNDHRYPSSGTMDGNRVVEARRSSMKGLGFLGIAIVAEVVATSALKASEGFSRWLPSLVVVVGYAIAFYFLSLTLRTMPVGVAYAIWSGLGIVLITAVGWIVFGQRLDLPALAGMGLIIAGVL